MAAPATRSFVDVSRVLQWNTRLSHVSSSGPVGSAILLKARMRASSMSSTCLTTCSAALSRSDLAHHLGGYSRTLAQYDGSSAVPLRCVAIEQ